jgi:single-stranded-DNA-specific exonuclease
VFTRDTVHKDLVYKGSGRSVQGLNLFELLEKCRDAIIQYGGHAMAAGVTINIDELNHFKELFDKNVKECVGNVARETGPGADIVLQTIENCEQLARGLQRMEPFGQGNPEPVILLKAARLENVKLLREHLKFSVTANGTQLHGIGFFMADRFETVQDPVDLGLKLKITRFRGRERIEAHAVTISAASC